MAKNKKNTPLFGSKIPPRCEYCFNNVGPEQQPVCKLGLKMPDSGKCPRYRYNPLLRAPRSNPSLPGAGLDPEEFKL